MDYSKFFHSKILSNLYEGAYFSDMDRKIQYWNKAAEKITGYKAEEVIGSSCRDNILVHLDEAGNNICNSNCPVIKAMEKNEICENKVYLRHKYGHRIGVDIRVIPIVDSNGQVLGAMEFFTENQSKAISSDHLKELIKLSFIDEETGLLNRRYCEMKIDSMINEFKNFKIKFGIMLFEIENKDNIIEKHGMDALRKVDVTIAKTLINNIKKPNIIGRWDKNTYLVITIENRKSVFLLLANKFKELMEKSFILQKNENVSAEIIGAASIIKMGDKKDALFQEFNNIISKIKSEKSHLVKVNMGDSK